MSITIDTSPDAVALAKNDLIYKLSTNNLYAGNGDEAIHSWELTGFPANLDTFDLSWFGGAISLTFTFRNVVGDSGLDLPTGSGNLTNYITDTLIPALKENYLLDRDFRIYFLINKIIFESRVKSPDFDLIYQSNPYGWDNGFVQTQAGIDPELRPGFRMLVQLNYRWLGEQDWRTAELERTPAEDVALINLKSVLSNLKKHSVPDLTGQVVVNEDDRILEYFIRYGEAFGEPLVVQRMKADSVKLALRAGFNQLDFEDLVLADSFLNFLTSRETARIRENQPYYLSFFNNTQNSAWELKVDLMENGESFNLRTLYSFNCPNNGLRRLPVNYSKAIDGVNLNGHTVTQIRYFLLEQGELEPDGHIINLYIDRNSHPDEIYLLYVNHWGCFETVFFCGEITENTLVFEDSAELIDDPETPNKTRMPAVFNKKYQRQLVIHSGYLSRDESESINDLINSDMIWLINEEVLIPVSVKPDNHPVTSTNNMKDHAYTLTLILNSEQNFSDVGNRIL